MDVGDLVKSEAAAFIVFAIGFVGIGVFALAVGFWQLTICCLVAIALIAIVWRNS